MKFAGFWIIMRTSEDIPSDTASLWKLPQYLSTIYISLRGALGAERVSEKEKNEREWKRDKEDASWKRKREEARERRIKGVKEVISVLILVVKSATMNRNLKTSQEYQGKHCDNVKNVKSENKRNAVICVSKTIKVKILRLKWTYFSRMLRSLTKNIQRNCFEHKCFAVVSIPGYTLSVFLPL